MRHEYIIIDITNIADTSNALLRAEDPQVKLNAALSNPTYLNEHKLLECDLLVTEFEWFTRFPGSLLH